MPFSLNVKSRQVTGKKVKILRTQGQIPAVLYGHKIKPRNLVVGYTPFERVYRKAGESSLIDLIIDKEKPVKVLIQEIQTDPVSGKFIHIDFHQVKMTEKIRTEIELKFVGESPAVKERDGVLVTNLDTVEVECLPQDLLHEIEVDLSALNTFEDIIYVKDLKIPSTITVLKEPDEVVVSVQPPRLEEVGEEVKEEVKEEIKEEKAEVVPEAKAGEKPKEKKGKEETFKKES